MAKTADEVCQSVQERFAQKVVLSQMSRSLLIFVISLKGI